MLATQIAMFFVGIIIVVAMCGDFYNIAMFFGGMYLVLSTITFALIGRLYYKRKSESHVLRQVRDIEHRMAQDIHNFKEQRKKVTNIDSKKRNL